MRGHGLHDGRPLHFSGKPVAALRYGFNIAGPASGITEGLPEAGDRGIQPMFEIDESIVGPQSLTEFLSRDYRARFFEKCLQDGQGLRLEFDTHTALAHDSALEISLEASETDGPVLGLRGIH